MDRTQIFWQVVPIQQPVQYGRDAAHISWAACVLRSLEDHMKERQHHLNESSSARLRRSQKLEILPSPNSKSLGDYFLMGAYIFDRRRDFNVRLVTVVYYVAQQFYDPNVWAHIIWICAYIFWTCAYILDMHIYFGHAHIFWKCAYILGKRIYFEQALTF